MEKTYYAKYLKETEYEQWDRFVISSPDGSIYSTTEYLDILCKVTSGNFKIFAVMQNDEFFGGIALYERTSSVGTFVAPRLLLYYNGLVLRDFETHYPSKRTGRQIEIMSVIEKNLSKAGYTRLYFKNRDTIKDARIFKNRGWTVEPSYTYVVPLKDLEVLWSRIEQNLRRLINRCTNEGVQLTQDDDFDSLYRMHNETHQRKGTSLYLPYDKFKYYFKKLHSKGLCRLYHARLPGGLSISSQLVLLGCHPVSHTVCAAADQEYLNIGVNPFLRWKVFEDLSNLGYDGNDLTDAALNPVTHFKSQLGGDLKLCLVFKKPDSFTFKLWTGFNKFLRIYKNRMKKYRCIS